MQLLITIAYFIGFLFLFFAVIYPAGNLIVRRFAKDVKPIEELTISLAVSFVVFVLSAVVFGIIHLRLLVLPAFIVLSGYSIYKYKKQLLIPFKELLRKKILLFIVVLAIIIQGVINFPSGYLFKNGLEFWSSQGNDGLWHVAVMEEVKKSMPVENPIYSGEKLYNYHYLTDILMGEYGRIFPFFGSLDLYFRFFPVLLSLLMSLSVFSFVSRWRKSENAGYWAIFFTSLAGGFGYIVTLIKNGKLFAGETVFWAAQGNTIIGNPPHAVAYGLLATLLLITALYLEKRDKRLLWLALLVGGLVAGFKVSGGFVLAVGAIVAGLVDLITSKKKELLIFSALIGLSNLVILKLMSKGALSFLIWEPWWFVRTTITAPGRVEWLDLEYRRQHYVSKHTFKATLRIIQVELEAFLIFVVGNLGTRFFGLFLFLEKGFKRIGEFFKSSINMFLSGSMLSGLVIVLLFVQRGIAYNLIQFMQYFIFIFGFFSAAFVAFVLTKTKNKIAKYCLAGIIIIVSLPTVIGNMVEFYGQDKTPLAQISVSELKALNYLKAETPQDAVILTYPYDAGYRFDYKAQPWPISVWYDTGYVSAISSRRTYLSNEGQVDILGISLSDRHLEVQKYFKEENVVFNREFIKNSKIGYVYVYKAELKKPLNAQVLGVEKYFENDEVIIYKVI